MLHHRYRNSSLSVRGIITCSIVVLTLFSSEHSFGQPGALQTPPTWSDSQILQRVKLQDARVLGAIDERAQQSIGDPAFASLMTKALRQHGGGVEIVPGQPTFPRGMKKGMYKDGNYPTPPGGASLEPRPNRALWKGRRALTSLEAMIGESLLGYSPQAAQSIRQSPNLQQAQGTSGQPGSSEYPGGSPPGYAGGEPGSGSPGGDPEMSEYPDGEPGMNGYPGGEPGMSEYPEGYEGYPGGNGYPANGSGGPGMRGPEPVKEKFTDEQFYETVIRALVANNTEPGWKAISQLADGRIPVTLDDGARDGLLIRHIASAHAADADEAREAAATLISTARSQGFDSPNWKLLSDVTASITDQMLSLKMPEPEENAATPKRPNPGQAAGMYAGGEEEYAGYDGEGASGYGAATAKTADAVVRPKVTRAGAEVLSDVMWTDEFSKHVAGVLDENGNNTPLELVALASGLPLDTVRHSLYKLFASIHANGAGGMIAGGLFTQYASDPGILPLLKSLPRQRPTRDGPDPSNPVESWNQAVLEVVMQLRDRLRSVETNSQLRYADRQMVPLHDRDAFPDVSIAIDVPGDSTEGTRAGSTKVYYTRVTIYDRQDKPYALRDAMAHYKKRSNGFERPQQATRTMWYDGTRKGSDGTRTSVDILIQEGALGGNTFGGQTGYDSGPQSAPAAAPPAAGGLSGGLSGGAPPAAPRPAPGGAPGLAPQGKPYTVDIIVVTIKDPKEPPAAKVASGK